MKKFVLFRSSSRGKGHFQLGLGICVSFFSVAAGGLHYAGFIREGSYDSESVRYMVLGLLSVPYLLSLIFKCKTAAQYLLWAIICWHCIVSLYGLRLNSEYVLYYFIPVLCRIAIETGLMALGYLGLRNLEKAKLREQVKSE